MVLQEGVEEKKYWKFIVCSPQVIHYQYGNKSSRTYIQMLHHADEKTWITQWEGSVSYSSRVQSFYNDQEEWHQWLPAVFRVTFFIYSSQEFKSNLPVTPSQKLMTSVYIYYILLLLIFLLSLECVLFKWDS